MKKTFISLSFVLSLFLVLGCTEDVQLEQIGEKGKTIVLHVGMPENQKGSRVAYDDTNLKLTWETGDELHIQWFNSEGLRLNEDIFALEDGEGTANGTFQIKVKEGAVSAHVNYQHNFGNVSDEERYRLTNTQHGDLSTEHLKYQMQLVAYNVSVDKLLKGNLQLKMQSAIMKFVFQHIPNDMNAPTSLRWQNNKETRSYSLLLDDINGPFTAYLAFPSMTLNAGGEFAVELIDAQKTYRTGITSTNGKHYVHGKRYTATIDDSFVWNKKKEQNNKILVKMTEGKTLNLPLYPEYIISTSPNAQGYYEVSTMDRTEITLIPKHFFKDNADIVEVKIPSTVTNIGQFAFSGTSITSIEIPEGVRRIQEWTFFLCKSLTDVKLPSTVTRIEDNAFNQCQKLININLPEGLETLGWGTFRTCLALPSIKLPDGISSIGDEIFTWCKALKSVTWPSGTTTIGSRSFIGCESLQTVSLPPTVNTIGQSAFYGCTQLKSINIPEGVTTLPDYVFSSCTALTNLSLPSTIVSIGKSAFSNCSALTSLDLPEGVREIGASAFMYCAALQKLHFPSTLISIGEQMIASSGLRSITGKFTQDNRYLIKDGKLYGAANNGLTHVVLPQNVVEINSHAFYEAKDVQTVQFNNSLTTINDRAFAYCPNLEHLTLSTQITSIADGAFFHCNGLKKVTVLSPNLNLGNDPFKSNVTPELNLNLNLKNQLSGKTWGGNSWNPVHIIDDSGRIIETIK